MLVAGTAAGVLGAGIAIQVMRPTSAFPGDTGAAGATGARATTATTAAPAQKAKVVSMVGNQPITWDELANECVLRHGEEILENLIDRRIVQQACDAQRVEVSTVEVDAEVNRLAQKFNMDSASYLQMLQTERNVSEAHYKRDIIWPMLALKKLAGEEIKITNNDIQKAFRRNYGVRVKARLIMLDNSRRAAEVWKMATDNPDDFETLAGKHSLDASSRHLGGMVPPIPRYAGADQVEEAAFKMKEGDISPVIQVDLNRFIILKCEGRTVPVVEKMDKEIETILKDQLHEQKTQESVATVFKKLKDEARVDNYLAGTSVNSDRKPGAARGPGGPVRPASAGGPASKKTASRIPDADGEGDGETPAAAAPAKAPARPKR